MVEIQIPRLSTDAVESCTSGIKPFRFRLHVRFASRRRPLLVSAASELLAHSGRKQNGLRLSATGAVSGSEATPLLARSALGELCTLDGDLFSAFPGPLCTVRGAIPAVFGGIRARHVRVEGQCFRLP